MPQDTIDYLHVVDPDLGWAIVKLTDAARGQDSSASAREAPDVELVAIGGDSSLIVVRAAAFPDLPVASMVPLGDGRAFLTFRPHHTADTLELALIDRLERGDLPEDARQRYEAFRDLLRGWRHDPALSFEERSIVVVERRRPVRGGAAS